MAALLFLAYAVGLLHGGHQHAAMLQERFDEWGKVIRILRDMKRQGV